MIRRVVVALALTVPLAGCSATALPGAALRLDSGKPVLLIQACPNEVVDAVEVRGDGGSWRVTAGEGSSPATAIRLLEAPEGWTVQAAELTELRPGSKYTVRVSVAEEPVEFTPRQLADLGSGKLLVPGEPDGLDEAEFRQRSKERCG